MNRKQKSKKLETIAGRASSADIRQKTDSFEERLPSFDYLIEMAEEMRTEILLCLYMLPLTSEHSLKLRELEKGHELQLNKMI